MGVVVESVVIIALRVAEHLLRIQLTVIEGFRSHLEALWLIKPNQLKKQVVILAHDIYQLRE